MVNIMDNSLYSPERYLKAATGKLFCIQNHKDDIEHIHIILQKVGIETDDNPIWDYPLDEIQHVIENDLQVVLVECICQGRKELRWFECPNGFYFY